MDKNKFIKKILKLFQRFSDSLTKKLIIVFSIVFSIFLITIIYVSYNRETEILKADFIVNNKNVLKYSNKNLEEYLTQVDELSLLFRKNERFMNILMTEADDYSSHTYVQDMIKNLFYSREDIEGLQFYIPDTKMLFSISRKSPNMGVEQNEEITSLDWYKKASRPRYFRDIEPGLQSAGNNYDINKGNVFLTFHRSLINISDAKAIGVISLAFNYKGINKLVEDAAGPDEELFGIFDNNKPIYFNNPLLLTLNDRLNFISSMGDHVSNGDFTITDKGKSYLVIYNISDKNKWKMVKLIPLDLVNKKAQENRNISFSIAIVFVILLIMIIIIISNAITSPLRKLARQMDKLGTGNFKAQVDVNGSDEIARLSKKFNSMVVQIDDLITEEYKTKLSEKNARLKALEAQINPHFLYNSLQAISSKAVLNGMKDISKMIEALAFTLRYCIKGGDMVKASKEIEHIKNYLILHEIRFEERLSVDISVDENIDNILIPKLSIQTIVENSIQHALEVMTEAILILIKIYIKDESLIIEVTDNGPGMTEERLKEVISGINDENWMENSDDSIGLKNLNTRLKLMFGNDAKLIIESSLNVGTRVSMVLPMGMQGGI